ncbi:hypothetical protein E2320_017966 [Naja naja]|nr:hypothetical protein E2320_017966 [Naja naja]
MKMRPAKGLRLRFSSLLLLLLWAAPRPCAAGDEQEEEDAGNGGSSNSSQVLLFAPQVFQATKTITGATKVNGSEAPEGSSSLSDMTEWASMFPDCEGHLQSPININTTAVSFSTKLEPLLLSGYDLPPKETLPLKNNGHTGLPKKMTLGGGGFPQPYQAAQLHLHWGSGHTRPGSEHTVDGHRYAGEGCLLSMLSAVLCVCLQIHVVHYSSHFESIQEAATEPGGLAVLAAFLQVMVCVCVCVRNEGWARQVQCCGSDPWNTGSISTSCPSERIQEMPIVLEDLSFVLFFNGQWMVRLYINQEPLGLPLEKPGPWSQEAECLHTSRCSFCLSFQVGMETNEPYQHILKHLGDIKEEGEDTVVAGFDIAKLLPYDLGRYFRYNGSLTTPPCYQTVNWTVFNQTVRLSQEQISVLEETLQGDDEEPIQNNFRLLQGLYGRTVLSSFHSLEKVQPTAGGPSEEGGGQAEPEAGTVPKSLALLGRACGGGAALCLELKYSSPSVPQAREKLTQRGLNPCCLPPGGGPSSPLPEDTPRDGHDPASGKDAEQQVDISLHTGNLKMFQTLNLIRPALISPMGGPFSAGDILAILFGSLFVATVLAFVFYIHKHRRQASR